MEGKAPAVAEAQDGGKHKPRKEQAPGGLEAGVGGKAEPTEKAAPAAAEAEGGKAKPAKETALAAAAQAQNGGKEEPAKDKTTAAAKEKLPVAPKAQDGGKKAAKAEKTPADKKPAKEKAAAPAKEKASDAAKSQDGEKAAAKAGKTPAAKKAQDESKEKPAKEKAPAAVKAQDGGKEAAKVESPPAAAEAGDGGKEPTEAAAVAAAKAQGEGEKAAKAMDKQQQPRGPEPPRPVLLQSLSCPAACQRYLHPPGLGSLPSLLPEEPGLSLGRGGCRARGAAGWALLTSCSCFQGGAALGRDSSDGDDTRGDHSRGVERGSDRARPCPVSPRGPEAPGAPWPRREPWHPPGEDIARCHRAAPGSHQGHGTARPWGATVLDRSRATPQPLPHPRFWEGRPFRDTG